MSRLYRVKARGAETLFTAEQLQVYNNGSSAESVGEIS